MKSKQYLANDFFFIGWADSTDEWVDSIRQVDVDLNFLLVLYSTVGLIL